MISIERTLTDEENLAIEELGINEQQLANIIIETMNIIIENKINEAKRKILKNKSLSDILT